MRLSRARYALFRLGAPGFPQGLALRASAATPQSLSNCAFRSSLDLAAIELGNHVLRNLAIYGHIGCELVDVDLAHLIAGVARVCGESAQHVARADLVFAAGIDVNGCPGWQEPAAGRRASASASARPAGTRRMGCPASVRCSRLGPCCPSSQDSEPTLSDRRGLCGRCGVRALQCLRIARCNLLRSQLLFLNEWRLQAMAGSCSIAVARCVSVHRSQPA